MSILIKRSQVDGLVAMKALLDEINASYPANKVTTTIAKAVEAGADPVNYNAQELLAELKTTIDGMIGGGDGLSLPELKRQIDKLNAELNGGTYEAGSVGGTETTLDGFKNKEIQDVVRIAFTWNGTAATPVDATKITDELHDGQTALTAYAVSGTGSAAGNVTEGTPLVSSTGSPITFNFVTKQFSATPYFLDVEASKATGAVDTSTGGTTAGSLVYTAFTGTFKVFPVGTWTLETLPADALLDNSEMQLIAYDQALQKVIVQLAADKNLIERIVTAVGDEAITDAVKNVTDVIDTRLDRLEGTDDSNLAKVAVKVDRIVGAPAIGTSGEAGYEAAETVSKTTQIVSKKYVDDADTAIKNDIGVASAATSYDEHGKVASSTVRGEINSIKSKLIYNDALVQTVKSSVTVTDPGTSEVTKVTDDNNTISETGIVAKFNNVDSLVAQNANNLSTFITNTAPDTYVSYPEVVNTFTKITTVSDSYVDSYRSDLSDPEYAYPGDATGVAHPQVVGKKIFNEKLSEIIDSIGSVDDVAYHFANIELAPAVTADGTRGITAKTAEAGPASATTPVLSAQYARNLITNEEERATFAENNIDTKTYDWANISVDDGNAINASITVTEFNATTGAESTDTTTSNVVTTRTAETLSETTHVPSVTLVDTKCEAAKNTALNQLAADKTELLNRITYTNTQLTAAITAVDDKTADWSNIQTSSGVTATSDVTGTVVQAAVSAESAVSAITLIASKQYAEDQAKTAAAAAAVHATNYAYDLNRAMDSRVDELEAVVSVTEKKAVVIDDSDPSHVVETIEISQIPITTSVVGRDNEIVIFVNGIGYFMSDGVYTLTGKVFTWDPTAAGFTLDEILDAGSKFVIVKYKYRNASAITEIAART